MFQQFFDHNNERMTKIVSNFAQLSWKNNNKWNVRDNKLEPIYSEYWTTE